MESFQDLRGHYVSGVVGETVLPDLPGRASRKLKQKSREDFLPVVGNDAVMLAGVDEIADYLLIVIVGNAKLMIGSEGMRPAGSAAESAFGAVINLPRL